MDWVKHVSALGDSALLVPFSLFLAGLLWRYESLRAASYLMTAIMLCASATVALKIAFLACGQAWGSAITSPSAHASMAAAVYGALAIMTVRAGAWWRRVVVFAGAGLLVAAIAVSRIALHAHSLDEVMLGLVVGATAAGLFARRYSRLHAEDRIALPLLYGGSAILLLALCGVYAPFEDMAYDIALQARTTLHICPAR